MSKENVRLFYRSLAEDKALQEKCNEINARLAEEYKDERLDEERVDGILRHELLPVAEEAGFEFSLDDLKEYSSEAKATGELADEELLAIVGGGGSCTCVLVGYGEVGKLNMSCFIYGKIECGNSYCLCIVGGDGSTQ